MVLLFTRITTWEDFPVNQILESGLQMNWVFPISAQVLYKKNTEWESANLSRPVVVSNDFLFSPLLGDMIQFWRIFFRWLEPTNFCCVHHMKCCFSGDCSQQVIQENGPGVLRIYRDVREELVGVKSGQKSGPWFVSFMKASWCVLCDHRGDFWCFFLIFFWWIVGEDA